MGVNPDLFLRVSGRPWDPIRFLRMSHSFRRFLRDNGLSLTLAALFLLLILGQILVGWQHYNAENAAHSAPAVGLPAYLTTGAFGEAVFENWESEFLQMAAYVILTACFIQRGSAESKDPEAPARDDDLAAQAVQPGAPGVLRWGPVWRALYARSLGIALGLLFMISFFLHWTQSARVAAQDAIEHGAIPPTTIGYLTDPQLWFESFQNWQSEFLSTAVLVILSIYLQQRESPESKGVAEPHSQTGD